MIDLSVIVPTRNRADVLASCLQSLTRQTLPAERFEVIVVDNGSVDATPEVARRFDDGLQLRYVFAAQPGLHVGRHEGWRCARSEVLAFVDDDIEAEPSWAQAVAEAFDDPRVGLVGGNNYPTFEVTPPPWLARWWDEPVEHGKALGYLSVLDFGVGRFELTPAYVWGCNFSVRRDVLAAAGGFHPDAMPLELLRLRGDGESHVAQAVRRSGMSILFDSRASVHHRVPADRMTPGYFERRAYAQGVSDSYSAVRRYGSVAAPTVTRWRAWAVPRVRALSARLRRLVAPGDAGQRALNDVRCRAALAYLAGYAFHQDAVRSDPVLLDWVLREDYLQ